MPVLDPEKRRILIAHGIDPDTVSDIAAPITSQQESTPVVNPTPEILQVNKPKIGKLASAGIGALEETLPTAGGLGVAGVLAKAPGPFKLAAIPAALATAMGAKEMQQDPMSFAATMAASPMGVPSSGSSAVGQIVGKAINDKLGISNILEKWNTLKQSALEQHPWMYRAGGFLPQAVAMRPSILPLKESARGVSAMVNPTIPTPVRGMPLLNKATPNQLNALANVGVGAALPAGFETYNILTDEKPFDLTDVGNLAISTTLGGLLNQPTAIGKRLGFTPVHETSADVINKIRKQTKKTWGPPALEPETTPELPLKMTEEGLVPKIVEESTDARKLDAEYLSQKEKDLREKLKKAEEYKAKLEVQQATQARIKEARDAYNRVLEDIKDLKRTPEARETRMLAEMEKEQAAIREGERIAAKGKPYQPSGEVAPEPALATEEVVNLAAEKELKEPLVAPGEERPTAKVEAAPRKLPENPYLPERRFVEPQPNLTKTPLPPEEVKLPEGPPYAKRPPAIPSKVELPVKGKPLVPEAKTEVAPAKTPEQIKAELLAAEKKPTEKTFTTEAEEGAYQEPSAIAQEQSSLRQQYKVTELWKQFWGKVMGPYHDIQVQADGRVYTPEGREVSGVAFTKQRVNQINPRLAGVDTWPHEMQHVLYDDFANSPSKKDQAFREKMELNILKSKEYNEWAGKRASGTDTSVREFLMEHAGIDAAERLFGKKGEMRNIMSDFWSAVKARYGSGGNATIKDYRRLLTNRLLYSAPSAKRMGASAVKPPEIGGEEKYGKEMQGQGQKEVGTIPYKELPAGRSLEAPSLEGRFQEAPEGQPTIQQIREQLGLKEDEAQKMLQAKTLEEARTILRNALNSRNINRKPGETGHNKALDEAYDSALDYLLTDIGLFKKPSGDVRFEEMRRAAEEAKPEAPKVTQKELPLEGDAAKFEEMRRATEEPKYQEAISEDINDFIKKPADAPQAKNPATGRDWSRGVPLVESRYDRIASDINTPEARELSDTLKKVEGETRRLEGALLNPIVRYIRQNKYTKDEVFRAARWNYAKDQDEKAPFLLSAREQELSKFLFESMRGVKRIQIDSGMEVKHGSQYRVAGMKPEGYFPNIIDQDVVYTATQKPGSPEAMKYEDAFVKHAMRVDDKLTENAARKIWRDYIRALGQYGTGRSEVEFGALRKAEGIGLPWELAEKNPVVALARYTRRAARDLAFFKYVQNQPRMLKMLNLKDQYGKFATGADVADIPDYSTHASVIAAKRSLFGVSEDAMHPAINAANRLFANLFMGPKTGIKNVVNIAAFVPPYMRTRQLPLLVEALTHMNDAFERAYKNNAIRLTYTDYDTGGTYQRSVNKAYDAINKMSDFLRKYQGRDLSNAIEGLYNYSLGELLASQNFIAAQNGDAKALKFMKQFGDTVDNLESLLKPGAKISEDDIGKVATRFTDRIRGTYSAEGLPSWAIEGQLAPFVQLSRFSIEKANTVWKDVFVPAARGDYGPLLKYTLGSLAVGAGMTALVEMVDQKRGPDPTLSELNASEADKIDYVAKLIGTLQMATFAGILGDFAKVGINAAQGKSSQQSPISFPAYEGIRSSSEALLHGVDALTEKEPLMPTLANLVNELATASWQSWRMAMNYARPEERERKEAFRDLRVFEELTGRKEPEATEGYNPLKNLTYKGFKRAKTVEESAERLPQVVDLAIERSTRNGKIDAERLKKEIANLARNQFRIMPSSEGSPEEFLEYYEYLKKTIGEEKADKRVLEFAEQIQLNRAKYPTAKQAIVDRLREQL